MIPNRIKSVHRRWGTGSGGFTKFDDLYGKLPVTLAADETAGLMTNGTGGRIPYGANLQPNPDMSGTSGTKSGAGAVNGDVADDWALFAATDSTVTAGKTANGYQKMYAAGAYCGMNTAGTTITLGEVWLSEVYISGLSTAANHRVVAVDRSSNLQFTQALSDGYNRQIFTSDATFTGGIYVSVGPGAGATIHWTRLRKLTGPSDALLSEVDRTLRANGTELLPAGTGNRNLNFSVDAVDKTAFNAAYDWTFSGNTASISSGVLAMTLTDAASGLIMDDVLIPNDRNVFTFNITAITGTWNLQYHDGSFQTIASFTTTGIKTTEFTVGAGSNDRLYLYGTANLDSMSITASTINNSLQEMQPTASLIERVSNAETFLIDNEPVTIEENLIQATEVDPDTQVVVTEDSIAFTALSRDESTYVYTDMDADALSNSDSYVVGPVNISVANASCSCTLFMLANDEGDRKTLLDAGEDFHCVFLYRTGDNYDIYLREQIGATSVHSIYRTTSAILNTDLWFKIYYTDAGTYGTLKCEIHTSTDVSGTPLTTLEAILNKTKTWQYLYCLSSYDDSNAADCTGTTGGVMLQRDLEIVKDGTTATMFWDGAIVDAEQTVAVDGVLHNPYGDLDLCGTDVIIPLQFGATIATGTLTINTLYEVVTTEVNHFGTGVVVGDYFISDGTETCNANNTVQAVVIS